MDARRDSRKRPETLYAFPKSLPGPNKLGAAAFVLKVSIESEDVLASGESYSANGPESSRRNSWSTL